MRAPTDYETAAVNEYVRNPEFRKAVANIYRRKLESDKKSKMSYTMTLKTYTKSAALYLVNNGLSIALLTGAMTTANAAATRAAHVHNEIGVVDIALNGFNQAVALHHEGPAGLARAAWPAARQIGEIRLRHRFEMFVNNNQRLSDLRNWTQRHLDRVHENITGVYNPGEALHRFNPMRTPVVNRPVPEPVVEGIRLQSRYPQRNPFSGEGTRLGDAMGVSVDPPPAAAPAPAPAAPAPAAPSFARPHEEFKFDPGTLNRIQDRFDARQASQAANDAIKNMGRVPADDQGLGVGEFDMAPEPILPGSVAPENEWKLPGGADNGLGLGFERNPRIHHLPEIDELSYGMGDERVRASDLQQWIFDDSGSNLVRAPPPGARPPDGLIRNLPQATPVAPRPSGFRDAMDFKHGDGMALEFKNDSVLGGGPSNWLKSGSDITTEQATNFRLDVADAAPFDASSFPPGTIHAERGTMTGLTGRELPLDQPITGVPGDTPAVYRGQVPADYQHMRDAMLLAEGPAGVENAVHPYARYQQGHFKRGITFSGNMINKMLAKGGRTAALGRFLVDHGNKVTAGFRIGGAAVAAAGIVYGGVRMKDMHKYRDELRSIATENPHDEQIQEFFKINDEATKRNDVYFGVNTTLGSMAIASGVAGAATAVGGGAALVTGGAAVGSAVGSALGTGTALALGETAAAGALGTAAGAAGAAAGAAAGEMGAAALATMAGPVGWAALLLGAAVGSFTWIYESGKRKGEYREYLTKLYGNSSAPSLDYYLDHKDPDLLHAVNGAKNYKIKDDATDDFKTYMEGIQSQIKSAEADIKIEEGVDDPRRQRLSEILQQTVPPGELDKTSDFISRQHAQDVQNGQQTKTWTKADIKDHANRQFKSDHDRYESQDQSPDRVNMTDQDVYNYNDKMNHTETLRWGYGKVEQEDQTYSKQEVTNLENRNTEAARNRQGRM